MLFLRASLVWLVTGVTLGVRMALSPPLVAHRAAHIHMLLLGFVTGMIFGIGYHVFPRFAARPLASPMLMRLHWWLANAGDARPRHAAAASRQDSSLPLAYRQG